MKRAEGDGGSVLPESYVLSLRSPSVGCVIALPAVYEIKIEYGPGKMLFHSKRLPVSQERSS